MNNDHKRAGRDKMGVLLLGDSAHSFHANIRFHNDRTDHWQMELGYVLDLYCLFHFHLEESVRKKKKKTCELRVVH